MPRAKARYRISVKDNLTGHRLRLELVEQPWPGRFWLRVDGKLSPRLPGASLSQVCDRLRRWLARPQRRTSQSPAGISQMANTPTDATTGHLGT